MNDGLSKNWSYPHLIFLIFQELTSGWLLLYNHKELIIKLALNKKMFVSNTTIRTPENLSYSDIVKRSINRVFIRKSFHFWNQILITTEIFSIPFFYFRKLICLSTIDAFDEKENFRGLQKHIQNPVKHLRCNILQK